MAKCFENFVSQALGFLTSFYAAELRYNSSNCTKKFLKKNYTSYTRQRNLLNSQGVSGVGSVVFFQKLFFVVV